MIKMSCRLACSLCCCCSRYRRYRSIGTPDDWSSQRLSHPCSIENDLAAVTDLLTLDCNCPCVKFGSKVPSQGLPTLQLYMPRTSSLVDAPCDSILFFVDKAEIDRIRDVVARGNVAYLAETLTDDCAIC